LKSVAIMQPYFFPYLGYFQLAAAASVFVFLNDAAFIKGGWINRNRYLHQGSARFFTVPLQHASPNRRIDEIGIAEVRNWQRTLLRALEQSYARAPHRDATLGLVEGVLSRPHRDIGGLAAESVRAVCAYVGLSPAWQESRRDHPGSGLGGAARVLELCGALGATRYVNAPGGRPLYDAAQFARAGIELRFLRPVLPPYDQQVDGFVAGLSIIDALMFNSAPVVRTWMEAYELE
jgi:hypothetical protein